MPIRFITVVLPTYNEVENIVPLADALHAAITHDHEVIVVDDASPDGTSAAVSRAIAEGRTWLKIETRTSDRGLTKSIRRGIELACGDVIVWLDCDFVGSSRVDLQACKLEYSIVSPK